MYIRWPTFYWSLCQPHVQGFHCYCIRKILFNQKAQKSSQLRGRLNYSNYLTCVILLGTRDE